MWTKTSKSDLNTKKVSKVSKHTNMKIKIYMIKEKRNKEIHIGEMSGQKQANQTVHTKKVSKISKHTNLKSNFT